MSENKPPRILGVSASLRNARFGIGSQRLTEEITAIRDLEALDQFIRSQSKIRAEELLAAGVRPLEAILRDLQKAKGDQGCSNSEAALAVALWGARQAGAEIDHLCMASCTGLNGEMRDKEMVRQKVLAADGIILSSPVYFGDRSSLAQEFVEFVRRDPECSRHIEGRVFAGISVGAKRNGGQEATLIYKIVDFTNAGMLAVGNDDKTTAQYGGTGVAGDIGTFPKDTYGRDTAIGAGHRIARVAQSLAEGRRIETPRPLKIAVWLLQDSAERRGHALVKKYTDAVAANVSDVEFDILAATEEQIARCIACDICPTHDSPRDEYGCIIGTETDLFKKYHAQLVENDGILVAAYSPVDRDNTVSVYQRFIERTRYLRRNHYALGHRLVSPLVFSEVGANQNLHIRMLTSFIRHLTVISRPLTVFEHQGEILDWDNQVMRGVEFVKNARVLAKGEDAYRARGAGTTSYNPMGYVISAALKQQKSAES